MGVMPPLPHPTAPLGGENETPEGGSLKSGGPHPFCETLMGMLSGFDILDKHEQ